MQTKHDLTAHATPIDELMAARHPNNARQHDLPTIKLSLQTHGQFAAVVRQASTGYVIKGNGTVEAAAALGWATLDATVLDVDDDQALRILLIDNKASDQGGYIEDELTVLLKMLGDDLTGTGYDEGDLDSRLAALAIKDSQGKSALELREGWENKDSRTIMLTFTVADHADLCARLDQLADQMGFDTYSDVAARLIREALPDATA